jgi:lipopolysaccharide/colanic/teichoic acid biosynthesis glycosyltransferase
MSREKATPTVSEPDAGLRVDPSSESVRDALLQATPRPASEPRWWRDMRRRRLLALADCCAVALSLAFVLPAERAIWLLAFLPVWILIAKLAGLYDADHRAMRHLTVDEAPAIAAWGVAGAVAVSLLGELTPAGDLGTHDLVLVAVIAIAADFALRVAARTVWRASTPPERVLIAGAGQLAHAMRRKVHLFGDLHMEAIENGHAGTIDRVVLANERIDAAEIAEIADLCNRYEAKLSLVSPLRGQATPHDISRLAELPIFEYLTSDVSRSTMMLKRALDLIIGVPVAILTAPLFPLIALAIWLEDRGPVLFTQRRAGLGGKPFTLLKFRTMHVGADRSLEDLLDELVERYSPEHHFRLDVKPGLTGPMQIHGRGELTFEERLAVELDYVENLSIGRDLRILALTPVSIVRGIGAF